MRLGTRGSMYGGRSISVWLGCVAFAIGGGGTGATGCTSGGIEALPTSGAGGGVLGVRGGSGFFAVVVGGELFVAIPGRGGSGVFGAAAFAGTGGGALETGFSVNCELSTVDFCRTFFFATGRGTAAIPPYTQRTRQHGMHNHAVRFPCGAYETTGSAAPAALRPVAARSSPRNQLFMAPVPLGD